MKRKLGVLVLLLVVRIAGIRTNIHAYWFGINCGVIPDMRNVAYSIQQAIRVTYPFDRRHHNSAAKICKGAEAPSVH